MLKNCEAKIPIAQSLRTAKWIRRQKLWKWQQTRFGLITQGYLQEWVPNFISSVVVMKHECLLSTVHRKQIWMLSLTVVAKMDDLWKYIIKILLFICYTNLASHNFSCIHNYFHSSRKTNYSEAMEASVVIAFICTHRMEKTRVIGPSKFSFPHSLCSQLVVTLNFVSHILL